MPNRISNIDFRSRMPAVRDQGQRETCLAFAVTSSHELGRSINASVGVYLSEEVLFWGGRQFQKSVLNDAGGISVYAAQQALKKWGQPEQYLWPYDGKRDHSALDYQPPQRAIETDNCYRADLQVISLEVDEIVRHLMQGYAVVLCVQMSKHFFQTSDGWLSVPKKEEVIRATHAVLAVGFQGNTSAAGSGYLVFRNSWGDDWGDGGYGYMPFGYIAKCGILACIVTPV
jgi:C1A family cysteine protease